MLATALSSSLVGLQSNLVRVEADVARGVPSFELVGMAEASVRESRVRVKSALLQVGVDTCESRIVINLAPADMRKTGCHLDLAVAVATLAALGIVPRGPLDGMLFLGELSLSGAIGPVRGVLPQIVGARKHGLRSAVVPKDNGPEAALVDGVRTYTATTLSELVHALSGEQELSRAERCVASRSAPRQPYDLSDVHGQLQARRALEIAAAGGHNMLLVGPPGSGKTMLARRLPGLLPPMSTDEALDVTSIQSVAGLSTARRGMAEERPFRAPHHTVSDVGLVGGGDGARPGEVSLSHHGVLFLDELAEFRRSALEALRQPMEDGVVTVSRAQVKATYPARPLVVAAMNPCPCGHFGDGTERCCCTPEGIRRYRGRLSGPLIDRFDMHVVLCPVPVHELFDSETWESSDVVRARVTRAREIQVGRVARETVYATCNAALSAADLEAVARPDAHAVSLLGAAVAKLGLSARAYGKVLRLARTLADLEAADTVGSTHVAEAIGLRAYDRGLAVAGRA